MMVRNKIKTTINPKPYPPTILLFVSMIRKF